MIHENSIVFVPGGGYAQPSSLLGKRDRRPVNHVASPVMITISPEEVTAQYLSCLDLVTLMSYPDDSQKFNKILPRFLQSLVVDLVNRKISSAKNKCERRTPVLKY